jgi:hypothetical protein
MNNRYIICILAICALNVISPLDARGFGHAGGHMSVGRVGGGGHISVGHLGGGRGWGGAFAGGLAGGMIGSAIAGSRGSTVVAPTTNVIFASQPVVHSIFD